MTTFKGIKAAEFTAIEEDEPLVPDDTVFEPPCTDPSELDDPVKVEWSCGLAIGQPYWQNTEIYESDECPGAGTYYVEWEDWEEGCYHINCDACGQYLEDDMHYEKVDP